MGGRGKNWAGREQNKRGLGQGGRQGWGQTLATESYTPSWAAETNIGLHSLCLPGSFPGSTRITGCHFGTTGHQGILGLAVMLCLLHPVLWLGRSSQEEGGNMSGPGWGFEYGGNQCCHNPFQSLPLSERTLLAAATAKRLPTGGALIVSAYLVISQHNQGIGLGVSVFSHS